MVYCLHVANRALQGFLVTALGCLVGLIVFLIVAMDHPLWGELSVSSDAFELLLKEWAH
jgi:hypothetical protein